jgi:ABC-type Fe3+-hydroxamate transport system substrate-binding protein
VTPDQVIDAQPGAVVVSLCGLSLAETKREFAALAAQDWFRGLPAWQSGKIAVVDGRRAFSRPGPGLVDAYTWLVGWLTGRDEVIPDGFEWEAWSCE